VKFFSCCPSAVLTIHVAVSELLENSAESALSQVLEAVTPEEVSTNDTKGDPWVQVDYVVDEQRCEGTVESGHRPGRSAKVTGGDGKKVGW
jgi:hypothetical protein